MPLRRSHVYVAAACIVVVLTIAGYAWHAGGYTGDDLLHGLQRYARGPAAPLIVAALYGVAGFLFIPVMLLIAVTGLAYGPVEGGVYALLGAVASAAAAYVVGESFSYRLLQRYAGPRVNAVRRQLKARGLIAVIAVRVVPSGPYTLLNLVAGASGIRFRDFVLGTVIGLSPGIAVTVGLVHGLKLAWLEPSAEAIVLVLLSLAAAAGLAYSARRLLVRRRARRSRDRPS